MSHIMITIYAKFCFHIYCSINSCEKIYIIFPIDEIHITSISHCTHISDIGLRYMALGRQDFLSQRYTMLREENC